MKHRCFTNHLYSKAKITQPGLKVIIFFKLGGFPSSALWKESWLQKVIPGVDPGAPKVQSQRSWVWQSPSLDTQGAGMAPTRGARVSWAAACPSTRGEGASQLGWQKAAVKLLQKGDNLNFIFVHISEINIAEQQMMLTLCYKVWMMNRDIESTGQLYLKPWYTSLI